MDEAVYLLCALTSIACAVLLYRGSRRSRTPLLFWSSLCFIGLALNNTLLFYDQVISPGITMYFVGVEVAIWRSIIALGAVMMLLYGLIWDTE